MAIDATVSGAGANSYVTLLEFDAYLAARLHTPDAATGADPAQREEALKLAANLLDLGFTWTGAPATTLQALVWPRTGVDNRNGQAITNLAMIPFEVKLAQMELATQLLIGDRLADNEPLRQGLSKLKVGSIELNFRKQDEVPRTNTFIANYIPDAVRAFLVPSWYVWEDIFIDPVVNL